MNKINFHDVLKSFDETARIHGIGIYPVYGGANLAMVMMETLEIAGAATDNEDVLATDVVLNQINQFNQGNKDAIAFLASRLMEYSAWTEEVKEKKERKEYKH